MLNAEQAMPEGGELTIQAAVEPAREGAAPSITLSLIDTGKGMSAETVSKVFRPFFTTRPGGTGLGLPTTRRILQAHGGDITLQSEPDKGTMFTIRLPTLPPERTEPGKDRKMTEDAP